MKMEIKMKMRQYIKVLNYCLAHSSHLMCENYDDDVDEKTKTRGARLI